MFLYIHVHVNVAWTGFKCEVHVHVHCNYTIYMHCILCIRCEQSLISTVSVRNCIKLYQTSEEHAAENLKNYCLQIISSHWVCVSSIIYMHVCLCIHKLKCICTDIHLELICDIYQEPEALGIINFLKEESGTYIIHAVYIVYACRCICTYSFHACKKRTCQDLNLESPDP